MPNNPTIEITSIGMAAYLIINGHNVRSEKIGDKVTWYVNATKSVQEAMNMYPGSPESAFQKQVLVLKEEIKRKTRGNDNI